MQASRFFSVPYDIRCDVTILTLRAKGGDYAALGRWIALLGMLYDADGLLDLSDETVASMVMQQLSLDDTSFFDLLAQLGLIDQRLWNLKHVVNKGVCDELEYRRSKSEAGKKGMEKRWGKKKEGEGKC